MDAALPLSPRVPTMAPPWSIAAERLQAQHGE